MPLPNWINDRPVVKGFNAKPTDLNKTNGSDQYVEDNKKDNEYINPSPITPQADLSGDYSNTYGDDAESGYYESEF